MAQRSGVLKIQWNTLQYEIISKEFNWLFTETKYFVAEKILTIVSFHLKHTVGWGNGDKNLENNLAVIVYTVEELLFESSSSYILFIQFYASKGLMLLGVLLL